MAACKDCGKQLGAFEKKYPMKEGGVICAACRQKPRVCSGCGGQIDRLAKHRVLNDGSFLCNACYEERKKKQAQKQVQVTQREEDFSAGYKGGFAGIAKQQVINMNIGATQVTVQTTAFLAPNRRVLWTMPYDKIKDIRIDTAENITATRLLLTGVFAFALKKKHRYLVIPFEDEQGMMQSPVFEGIFVNKILEAVYPRVGAARARAQPVEQPRAQAQPVEQQVQTQASTIDVARAQPVEQPQQPPVSVFDELAKLAALRDQGIVTEQEFQEQKAKLLGTETTDQSPKRFDPQTGRPL
ncbi:MAG: SHOCT domain-containing protein [Halobacteriota archaeon]|jgi:hypothetical protein